MPSFGLSVPHQLSKQEATERVKHFSEKVREHHQDKVKDVHQEWNDDTLHFGFKTLGVRVDGNLTVADDEVSVQGSLPIAAMMFKGQIESAIRDELTQLLS